MLETKLNYLMEAGANPRDLERRQLLRLMNLIAQEIYTDKFDLEIGTDKIENSQIARTYFIMLGRPDPQERLFQYPFPEQVWENICKFLRNLVDLPLWVNRDLSETVFGGKQNNNFWKTVFETGRTPQGMQVLAEPLNLIEMIK